MFRTGVLVRKYRIRRIPISIPVWNSRNSRPGKGWIQKEGEKNGFDAEVFILISPGLAKRLIDYRGARRDSTPPPFPPIIDPELEWTHKILHEFPAERTKTVRGWIKRISRKNLAFPFLFRFLE